MERIDDKTRTLFKKALMYWGKTEQLRMVMEECAELIAIINRFHRRRASLTELLDEIADAYIMVEQARQMVGPDLVDAHVHMKLERLRGYIEDAEKRERDRAKNKEESSG